MTPSQAEADRHRSYLVERIATLRRSEDVTRQQREWWEEKLAKHDGQARPEPTAAKALPDPRTFGPRRRALGLSQPDVADLAHIGRGYLSDIESGRRTNPWSLVRVHETLTRLEVER